MTVSKRCANRRLLSLVMTCSNLLARKYEHAFLALAKARLSANCPRKIFMHDEETCMNARVTPKATMSRRRTADIQSIRPATRYLIKILVKPSTKDLDHLTGPFTPHFSFAFFGNSPHGAALVKSVVGQSRVLDSYDRRI